MLFIASNVSEEQSLPNCTAWGITTEIAWYDNLKQTKGAWYVGQSGKNDRGVFGGNQATYAYWGMSLERSNGTYKDNANVVPTSLKVVFLIHY